MNRTAPWLSLAVFCALTPGLALASWGRSTSSSSSKRDDDGKKDSGAKKGGREGRGHGSGNGGGGGRGVGQGGGNSGGGSGNHGNGGGHHADPPDDRHRGRGVGHREHGNGNGYGHDHDDRDDDADNGGHPATGGVPGNGRDGRHHGDHDDDGDYVVVDPGYVGPRWGWGWGWGWWGGGYSDGYREGEVRREHRPHPVRVRLLGEASGATRYSEAANQGSLMGSVRIEGPRWGVVLDGRSVADADAMAVRTLGLGSAHLTYALFSGEDGARLRLEAGAATLFSQDLIATGPSVGASAELPVFLGLGLEGSVHATAFPFVSASWSAGGFARLGALSLHAGVRRLFIEPTSAGTGPYVALALTFG